MNRRAPVASLGRRTAPRCLLAGIAASPPCRVREPGGEGDHRGRRGFLEVTTNTDIDGALTITGDGTWSETRSGLSGR